MKLSKVIDNSERYSKDWKGYMKRIASILTVAAAMFALGWLVRGYHLPDTGKVVETRIDTVYYERPQPTTTSSKLVAVNVPRIVFAPAAIAKNATTDSSSEIPDNSGNLLEIPTSPADSVAVDLAIETRTYEDSLYRAQVSGPTVGRYRPALDWIEVYDRTNTITRTETKRHRFAVTAGVGAAYTPAGFQPTVGVQVGVILWGF